MAPVIVAKDLYKCYAGFSPVLRGVNIQVEPGEIVAIMGPSGCGKSTMLHILGMLHAPDAGSLDILGTNVLTLTRQQTAAFRREHMGFVMQASNLFEHSTVFENVEFPLIYENIPPQERWERVIRALELVRLSARVHYRSNRLSGGEQQRVAIARAMVNNPRILLADEPTGALDARTSRLIMENFRNLCHSGGVAMVMVTHDPKMADFCDSVYTLDDGILNCKKHEIPVISPDGQEDFLSGPEPLVHGALIAARFPSPLRLNLMAVARRMDEDHLLSRIYALTQTGFLGNPQGYALPLPVRRMGLWQKIRGLGRFLHTAPHSTSLWRLWRQLGDGTFVHIVQKLGIFSSGGILASWAVADKCDFLFAASGRKAATGAWIAARRLGLPFALAVSAEDLSRFSAAMTVTAKDAAFIACGTEALRQAVMERIPDLPASRVLLVRDPLPVESTDEDSDSSMPPQQGKPADILTPGPQLSAQDFSVVLEACRLLKVKGIDFRLTIIGAKSARLKSGLRRKGLARLATFTGSPQIDTVGEIFKLADIFVIAPSQDKNSACALPWEVCEAMEFGLGIAVSGLTPGLDEALTPDATCLVSPANDAANLAEHIHRLSTDTETRAKLGKNARAAIRRLLRDSDSAKILKNNILAAIGQTDSEDSGKKPETVSPGLPGPNAGKRA